jgi:hypothetical protein
LAIVTERWDGMRWTRRHRARNGIAGRYQLREQSSGSVDERCRSVRQNRVDLTPQWSASSLRKASRPDRARMSRFSAGDGGEKSPMLRGEREISRKAIAQGMSDVLRCPVCSCAPFSHNFAHETAGAARIRHSLLPHFRGTTTGIARANQPRDRGRVSAVRNSLNVIARSPLVRRSPPPGEGGCDEAIHLPTDTAVKRIASLTLAMTRTDRWSGATATRRLSCPEASGTWRKF